MPCSRARQSDPVTSPTTEHTVRISKLAFAMSLLPLAAAAQERKIEEIVVTGTKFSGDFGAKSGVPIERMPQSVQVISADDIVAQGASSIGSLLRNIPSANVGQSRVSAYQSFSLRVRGFLADQMRNGIRQRYYEDVDASALSNIERVEVLKGPSGVLYGQSAVGGIISIITKRPEQDVSSSFAGTIGSYGQKAASFDITGGLAPGLTVRFNGEVEDSNTFIDQQGIKRVNGALSVHFTPSDSISSNLVMEYVERETKRYAGLPIKGTVESNGGAALARGLNLGEPAIDNLTADAPLVQFWTDVKVNDVWTITPRLQYQEFNSAFNQIRLRSPSADLVTITRNGRDGREDDQYTIAQLDTTATFATGLLKHKFLAGYEYDMERAKFTQYTLTNVTSINVRNPVYNYNAVLPTKTFAFSQHYDLDGHAIYAQDQVGVSDRWDVIAAARYSWMRSTTKDVSGPFFDRSSVDTVIWSIGSTYQVNSVLSAYAGFNTGFDVEGSAGARSATGAPLKPEKSNQAEAGLRLRWADFHGSIAAFQIKRTNALTTDPLNPDFSINVGAQRVRGFEVEGEWRATDWWTMTAGYAYLGSKITKSNDGDQGLRIGDVPAHTVAVGTEVSVPGTALVLRGGVNYVGNRLLVNGSSVHLPHYTVANVGASYRIKPATLTLSVSNVFDKTYYTASGNAFAVTPGDPRMVSLRLGLGL